MISAAAVSSLRVLRIRERQPLLGVRAVGGDQRHHAHPGLEPGQAQHQQREGEHRRADDVAEAAAAGGQRVGPVVDQRRGWLKTSTRPTTMTTALRARKTATSGMATPTASLNPSRNTPPRISSSTTVTRDRLAVQEASGA